MLSLGSRGSSRYAIYRSTASTVCAPLTEKLRPCVWSSCQSVNAVLTDVPFCCHCRFDIRLRGYLSKQKTPLPSASKVGDFKRTRSFKYVPLQCVTVILGPFGDDSSRFLISSDGFHHSEKIFVVAFEEVCSSKTGHKRQKDVCFRFCVQESFTRVARFLRKQCGFRLHFAVRNNLPTGVSADNVRNAYLCSYTLYGCQSLRLTGLSNVK